MSEAGAAAELPGNLKLASPSGAGGIRAFHPLASTGLFAGASILQIVFSFASMLGMCLVARVFYPLRAFPVDSDLWWHIKNGQSILATHRWAVTDPYSFTVGGQHWMAAEWLGDVLLAAVYRAGGLRGLGFLLILLASLFALTLYYYATVRCGNPKAGFLATAILINLANSFNLRPQMLGYLFLILALIILERFRQGHSRAIWLLPLLMLVWVNTHGSWIIGLGTVAVYMVAGFRSIRLGNIETQRWSALERRDLAFSFLLSVLAVLITPYGAGPAKYPFQVGSSLPVSFANIQEWQPIGFRLAGDKLFLVLILGFFLVQVLARPKWRLEELGLFLFGTAMACAHLRFLSLFVPFFAAIFVTILARWIPRYDRTKELYGLNAAIILGLLGVMVWYFPSESHYREMVSNRFPVKAVEYLNTHSVPTPMYNSYEFGGYLLWSRGPEHKVFIDGRSEIYERAGVFQDQVALFNLEPGSLATLKKYEIQSCLLLPDEALSTALAALPNWEKIYADDRAVLFVRRKGGGTREHSDTASTASAPELPGIIPVFESNRMERLARPTVSER